MSIFHQKSLSTREADFSENTFIFQKLHLPSVSAGFGTFLSAVAEASAGRSLRLSGWCGCDSSV